MAKSTTTWSGQPTQRTGGGGRRRRGGGGTTTTWRGQPTQREGGRRTLPGPGPGIAPPGGINPRGIPPRDWAAEIKRRAEEKARKEREEKERKEREAAEKRRVEEAKRKAEAEKQAQEKQALKEKYERKKEERLKSYQREQARKTFTRVARPPVSKQEYETVKTSRLETYEAEKRAFPKGRAAASGATMPVEPWDIAMFTGAGTVGRLGLTGTRYATEVAVGTVTGTVAAQKTYELTEDPLLATAAGVTFGGVAGVGLTGVGRRTWKFATGLKPSFASPVPSGYRKLSELDELIEAGLIPGRQAEATATRVGTASEQVAFAGEKVKAYHVAPLKPKDFFKGLTDEQLAGVPKESRQAYKVLREAGVDVTVIRKELGIKGAGKDRSRAIRAGAKSEAGLYKGIKEFDPYYAGKESVRKGTILEFDETVKPVPERTKQMPSGFEKRIALGKSGKPGEVTVSGKTVAEGKGELQLQVEPGSVIARVPKQYRKTRTPLGYGGLPKLTGGGRGIAETDFTVLPTKAIKGEKEAFEFLRKYPKSEKVTFGIPHGKKGFFAQYSQRVKTNLPELVKEFFAFGGKGKGRRALTADLGRQAGRRGFTVSASVRAGFPARRQGVSRRVSVRSLERVPGFKPVRERPVVRRERDVSRFGLRPLTRQGLERSIGRTSGLTREFTTPRVSRPPETTRRVPLIPPRRITDRPGRPPIRTTVPPGRIITPPRRPPVVPEQVAPSAPYFFKKEKEKQAKALQEYYNVLVKESPYQKGRFFKANKKALSKRAAMSLGAEIVDNSTARTFKIQRGKGQRKKVQDLGFFSHFNSAKFRPPKRVRKDTRGKTYVEKTDYAIDTYNELMGITAKGWVAQRRKTSAKAMFGDFSAKAFAIKRSRGKGVKIV